MTSDTPIGAPPGTILQRWAAALQLALDEAGLSRRDLQAKLAADGYAVTEQGIGCWLRGDNAPRPHHQIALAHALGKDVRDLFPLERAS